MLMREWIAVMSLKVLVCRYHLYYLLRGENKTGERGANLIGVNKGKRLNSFDWHLGYANSHFRNKNIKEIDYPELEDFFHDLPSHLSSKSKFNIKTTLHSFWTWVVKRNRKKNPPVEMPEFPEISFKLKFRNTVDLQTQDMVLDELKKIVSQRVWVAIRILSTYPKTRPGELRSVKEKDIDNTYGIIRIRYPKSPNPEDSKEIKLLDEDLELIKSLPPGFPEQYLLRHDEGKYVGKRYGVNLLNNMWKKACRNLGVKDVQIAEVEVPQPQPNQVLVRVHACGLNRADLLETTGRSYGHVGGGNKVMGASFCGEVVKAGSEADSFSVGDRVMSSGAAGWAEYAVADWRRTLPVPSDDMDFVQASTLMTSALTMHDAIVTNGRFVAGESILIQGASSGVGLMGLQIARLKGAKLVIGTSTNPDKRARLGEFGADLALDSRDEGWVDQVLEATDGAGVDLIVDQISGYVANQNLAATAINGRIVNVGRLGGFTGEFDFDLHAARRIDYIGVTFRTRTIEEVAVIARRAHDDLWDAIAAGKLAIPVDRVFDFEDAGTALEYMSTNAHFGRIVLSLTSDLV